MKYFWARASVAILALGLGGCGSGADLGSEFEDMGDAETVRDKLEAVTVASTFTVKLPTQVPVSDSVLTASGTATLNDRAQVLSASGKGAVSTTGVGRLTVGFDAKPRKVVANATATIQDRAKINGDLIIGGAATIGGQVQVFGTQQLNANVDEQPVFQVPVLVPDLVLGNINLEPDRTQVLTPAKYGTVSVKSRSTITLSTGVYEFASLQVLEPQAKILIDDAAGPVIIYVKNSFIYRGGVQNKAVSGRFPNVMMVYLGTQELWVESPFQGHLFAPNSTAHLRPGTGQFIGSFWGKNVDTNPDTVLVHKSFDLGVFFPRDPVLGEGEDPYVLGQSDPVRHKADSPIIATPVSGVTTLPVGEPNEPNGTPNAVNCVTNLIAVPSSNPAQAASFRYMTDAERSAAGCSVIYEECTFDANGNVSGRSTPPIGELNRRLQANQPPVTTSCSALAPKSISYTNPDGSSSSEEACGVDDAVLSLPLGQRRVCSLDSQCNAAAGELCAAFCPPGKVCADLSEYEHYCAAKRKDCAGLPVQSACIERSVCPFDGYTGDDYAVPTNPKEVPPASAAILQPTVPGVPGYKLATCTSKSGPSLGSTDETTPPQDSGNDQWGISFTPTLNYGFNTPQHPLAITQELGANGEASFDISAKVWGSNVPIFYAGVEGAIGPDELTVTKSTQLFGQEIDLTGEIEVGSLIPATINPILVSGPVADQIDAIGDAFDTAQVAQGQLLQVRDFLRSHDLSDLTDPLAKADAKDLCVRAMTILGSQMGVPGEYKSVDWCKPEPLCEAELNCSPLPEAPFGTCGCGGLFGGEVSPIAETSQQAATRFQKVVTDAIEVWKKNLEGELAKFGGDPQEALAQAIAPVTGQLPGTNEQLARDIPLKAGRHRFVAFNLAFTFPVGPVPVTMEIELAGSWGVDANLELEGQFDPRSEEDLFARAGASIVPGMDIQVLAFAGIDIGFAQVGIGGDLTLIDLEIPIRGGGEVRGERIPDTRPFMMDLGPSTQAQDISSWVNSAERLANTRWNAGFYYGAGLHAELLAGNINLQARIRLFFFSVSFKQILASWNGIEFDKAFVGSIQPVQGLQLPDEMRDVVTNLAAQGKNAADLKALVPLVGEGLIGNYGSLMPMLTYAGLNEIWPPDFDSVAAVVALPSNDALCGPYEGSID